jgi:DNA repair protein RadD
MKARPYQQRAIDQVLALIERGVRRILIVLPTGGGKTVIATKLIQYFLALQLAVIFFGHRKELIRQPFTKVVRNGLPPNLIGIMMGDISSRLIDDVAKPPGELDDASLWEQWARRRPRAPLQIASIDTFRNRVPPDIQVSMIDEAHRAASPSYVSTQAIYPSAIHIGYTATPWRMGGKGLGAHYDAIVVVATFAELVELGYLVEPKCYGTERKADLSRVRRSGDDYNQADLAAAVDKGELIGDIVSHWQRRGNNAPTFCFAAGVEHSKHIVERFREAGISAVHVDGETDPEERDRAVAGLKDGSIKVVSNCGIFTEGTDVPCVKTIVLARPTMSEALYLQMAGRGARPCEQCEGCKRDPKRCERPFIILDHAGCCTDPRLGGLPQEPREYTLEDRPKRRAGVAPSKPCPQCLAIVAAGLRECPCGHVFEIKEPEERKLEEKEGELVELTPQQAKQLAEWNALVDEWRELNRERRECGQKLLEPKWCKREWKRRTGFWNPKGSKLPRLEIEELAHDLEVERKAEQRVASSYKPPPGTTITLEEQLRATLAKFSEPKKTVEQPKLVEWTL